MNIKLLTIMCKDILLSGRMKVLPIKEDERLLLDTIGIRDGYESSFRILDRGCSTYTQVCFQTARGVKDFYDCKSILKEEVQYKLFELSETDKNIKDVVFVLFMMGIVDRDTYCKYFMSVDRILNRVCVVDDLDLTKGLDGIEKYFYFDSGEYAGYSKIIVSRTFVDLLDYLMFVAYVDSYWSLVDGRETRKSASAVTYTKEELIDRICEYRGFGSDFVSGQLLFMYPVTGKFSYTLRGLKRDRVDRDRYNYMKTLDYFHDRKEGVMGL